MAIFAFHWLYFIIAHTIDIVWNIVSFFFFYQIRVTIFAVFITELFTLSKISGITQYDDRIKTFLAKKVCERRVLSCWDFT